MDFFLKFLCSRMSFPCNRDNSWECTGFNRFLDQENEVKVFGIVETLFVLPSLN